MGLLRGFKRSFSTGFSSFVGLEDRRPWDGVGVCMGDGCLNIIGAVPLSPSHSQASTES